MSSRFSQVAKIVLPFLVFGILFMLGSSVAQALNISSYRDTISDSTPGDYSNHNLEFTIDTSIAPGGYIEFTPPPGFTIVSTSSFSARNVEVLVNGAARTAAAVGNATTDTVLITPGTPGAIRYTLNPSTGITSGDQVQLLIGTNTSGAGNGNTVFSTSTGTTTLGQDIGILNASTTGTHKPRITIGGGAQAAYANFVIALVDEVTLGPIDTTEEIPPERFNGAPTGNVGGTTLSVELSLETNEFAACRYSLTPGVEFTAMTDTFQTTGSIVHVQLIVGLANNTSYTYYVRCRDDEGNINIDDYEISFTILDVPEGDPNTEGDVDGDGTGSGNDGSGSGDGGGGQTGGSDGDASTSGSTSGGGGSGGGGGGGSGSNSSSGGGGGFESTDAPFRSGDGRVIINGYSFPSADVTILVDGQIAETVRANNRGEFTATIDEIARGVYTFGVYATDDNNIKSSTFSTSFSVQGARTSSLSNVNVMPTILVRPDPVEIGSQVTVSGFAIPDATITVENQNDKTALSLKSFTTTSNSSGAWSTVISTAGFTQGTYKVRARAVQSGGVSTNFSNYTYYGVGQEADQQLSPDLNRDGSVNLIDFSILLFWWGGAGGDSDPPADINGDGTVSLTDFSILLFNWTG